jgi:hypothetical protein|tara:strand:- start:3153 stop:4118 length:966 start_codon:yes stop_codon:yes gene_type:complete
MAAFKQFNSQDIIVSPLEVNKSFTFAGDAELSASNVDVNRFLGKNINFTASNNNATGFNSGSLILSQSSIYDSVKELYYSNYITSSFGDSAVTASVLLGSEASGDVLVGGVGSNGRYANYLQSTLTQSRYFPTGSNDNVLVFSIPSKLFGDYIQPESFELYLNSDDWSSVPSLVTDDGDGNLLSASINVGNIFYPHGIAVITQQDWNYSVDLENLYETDVAITCSFSSSYTIYETQYKCTIDESEFGFSQNPSIISSSLTGNENTSSGVPYNFATGSYFSPYVTTVGMYNEQYELLAVGKLAQPLPTSRTTDTTILVNIDR